MKVIMPCWLVDEQLINLTQLACESFKGHELILMDNGSPMGKGVLRELADTLIVNKENLNYAGAVNQGLRLCADETWVCVANNDIRVPENWSDVAEEIMRGHKNVCSVHFRMIPYDQPFNPGNDTWTGGRERWCSSSFFVVRPTQLYDLNFKNSYDDYDFWHRFRSRGYVQAYTNKAEYQHFDSSSVNKDPRHKKHQASNYEYYKKKHGEYPDVQFEKKFKEQMNLPWKPFP